MSEYMPETIIEEIKSFTLDSTWIEDDPIYRYEARVQTFAWRLGYIASRDHYSVPFYANDIKWIPKPEMWIQESFSELTDSTSPRDEVA